MTIVTIDAIELQKLQQDSSFLHGLENAGVMDNLDEGRKELAVEYAKEWAKSIGVIPDPTW